jgi:hypothetical protein
MNMECELREWNDTVFKARHRFYELNYFTTVQLLMLRQKLGSIHDLHPTVLVLLQGISSEIQSENIRRVVREVAGESSIIVSTTEDNERTVNSPASSGAASTFDISSHRQKPTLTEEELSVEKKSIMLFIVQKLDCSKMLVLRTFEECEGKSMDRYDYLKYCCMKSDEDIDHSSDECEGTLLENGEGVIEKSKIPGPTRLSYLFGEYALQLACSCLSLSF